MPVTFTHKHHPGRARIMYEFRLYSGGDAWGDTMGWWFGIADVLWHAENGTIEIPAHWQYRHSPVCREVDLDDWPGSEIAEGHAAGYYSADDLLYAGEVLTRYAALLDKAGLSY